MSYAILSSNEPLASYPHVYRKIVFTWDDSKQYNATFFMLKTKRIGKVEINFQEDFDCGHCLMWL